MSKNIAIELAKNISTGCVKAAIDSKSMEQTFLKMLDRVESAILIKIAHHFTKTDQLTIAIDPTSDTVERLSLGTSKDMTLYQKGTLYIAGNHSDDIEKNRVITQGFFLHGIVLFIADVVFDNDFSSLKGLEECQSEGVDEPAQFLSNAVQLLWTGNGDHCNPKIIAFYQNQFIPACEARLKQLQHQSALNKPVSTSVTQFSIFDSEASKKEPDSLNPKSEITP
ncbi:hypothetical protein DIZ81_10685 [Legionella taurinensis]|uniref:Uncharacterized protein n=1 Tax=Legionella taurinensis TaxID=70611 RepID=A0A3A5L9F7_9GAMM|nr:MULTISPECIES: hypothetical protein [Legionella]MDX1838203.1 hypothetical protein [Legionella taurinensis]PUT39303.1 hypothetical protein DB744_10695 [Legionella taurinensis]PUT40649.1 hypothetical protein DB746_11215 [Legionella taurinensis]PUT44069.1 hypothetical protein DB743_09415 [Legionella taurinensis]PUT46331.1 hypothetical protein DB745_11700 [Legionella taurinensis]